MTIWTAPTELPDLRRVGMISDRYRDATTRDCAPIADRPGRGATAMSAASASPGAKAARSARSIFPLRHPDTDNFDPAQVYRWLKDHIAAGVRFVTMNGLYDWGWLRTDGGVLMPPSNQLEEVGALAAMVDENQLKYTLDAICQRHGLPGKDTALLEEACKAAGFKISKKTPIQSYIWQLPARFVGPYAEIDAVRTLEAVRNSHADRRAGRNARRLSAGSRPAADGA